MKQKIDKQKIDGILLINKQQGLTSNAVLQQVKRLYQAKKAGHTGSLDPLATGMLPLCFGEATKFSQYLLDADKCYQVTGLLGVKTNTGDSTGDPIETAAPFHISEDDLKQVLAGFTGAISQVPPMFSALKHQGQPLYKLARKGIDIERKPRDISIHQLHLDFFDGKYLQLSVTCSKGTYIRSLIEDIGQQLGVGAHVTQLHRVYTKGFEGLPMYRYDDLVSKSMEELQRYLLPPDAAITTIPTVQITDTQAHLLGQGRVLEEFFSDLPVGVVRLYTEGGIFVGLGEMDDLGVLKAKRLLSLSV